MLIVAWGTTRVHMSSAETDLFLSSLANAMARGGLQVDPDDRCHLVFTPNAMLTTAAGEMPPTASYRFTSALAATMALALFNEHLQRARKNELLERKGVV
jgi:hypothetical protein